jgi:hypothetical protein
MVLSDGDLPALTACAAAAEAAIGIAAANDRPVVVPFPSTVSSNPARMGAVARQAEALLLNVLPAPATIRQSADGESESHDLISSAYAAARMGIGIIWWPECPGNLERMGEVAERALLAGRIVAIDSETHGLTDVRIETPYLDLNDEQLAELALDLAVPLETAWWWNAAEEEAVHSRARWIQALARVGWVVRSQAQPLQR